jgi:C1A family cysteine protease
VANPRARTEQRGARSGAALKRGKASASGRFIVRNSWGSQWGKKGYCFMPYAYLTDPDLAADFWTIRMVEI